MSAVYSSKIKGRWDRLSAEWFFPDFDLDGAGEILVLFGNSSLAILGLDELTGFVLTICEKPTSVPSGAVGSQCLGIGQSVGA